MYRTVASASIPTFNNQLPKCLASAFSLLHVFFFFLQRPASKVSVIVASVDI